MKIAIFANGYIGDYDRIKDHVKGCDYIICADGGVKHADILGIMPDLIVGDLDSAPAHLLERYRELGIRIDKFPTQKDDTDTQIAVDSAIAMAPRTIILIGATGDRWDHSYANIMLLHRIADRGIEGWIVDDRNIITISNSKLVLSGYIDQVLSLLPFGGDVFVDSTSGLKYPIYQKRLYTNYPIGISNVFIDDRVEIDIKSGWLLAIMINNDH